MCHKKNFFIFHFIFFSNNDLPTKPLYTSLRLLLSKPMSIHLIQKSNQTSFLFYTS